eukprot:11172236-Lingulodinium_polyedra.AAC.1
MESGCPAGFATATLGQWSTASILLARAVEGGGNEMRRQGRGGAAVCPATERPRASGSSPPSLAAAAADTSISPVPHT